MATPWRPRVFFPARTVQTRNTASGGNLSFTTGCPLAIDDQKWMFIMSAAFYYFKDRGSRARLHRG